MAAIDSLSRNLYSVVKWFGYLQKVWGESQFQKLLETNERQWRDVSGELKIEMEFYPACTSAIVCGSQSASRARSCRETASESLHRLAQTFQFVGK